jgi:hypothetical protein
LGLRSDKKVQGRSRERQAQQGLETEDEEGEGRAIMERRNERGYLSLDDTRIRAIQCETAHAGDKKLALQSRHLFYSLII